jgi:hypothetical protein
MAFQYLRHRNPQQENGRLQRVTKISPRHPKRMALKINPAYRAEVSSR